MFFITSDQFCFQAFEVNLNRNSLSKVSMMPYLAISMATSVAGAVTSSLGLEALGIGNRREPTLGMMIYWVRYYASFLRGQWWLIAEPIIAIAMVFICFLLISIGLDEFANPRTRRTV